MSLANTFITIGNSQFQKLDFIEWAYKHLLIESSGRWKPFSLEGHEPLKELYENYNHPYLVIRKCAQVGISTYSAARALYLGHQYNLSSLYYFPTDFDVYDFVDGKFSPLLEASESLKKLQRSGDPNNKGLKVFRTFKIYFRGVFNKRKVKGVTGDYLVKDELDEANQENLQFANDRLLHSEYGYITELSQPSIPDYGIDLAFKSGDQRYWGVRCGCRKWIFVDEVFPDCIISKRGNIFLGCPSCGKPIDIKLGTWVPKYPEISKDKKSYHLSHLLFPIKNPQDIFNQYKKLESSIEKKNFYISVLGMPFASQNSKPVTITLLNELQSNYKMSPDSSYSYFGMDAGDKCHLVFGHFQEGILRVHWMEEMPADDEDRIIKAIKRQGIISGVVDAMPYKTLAKNIARTFQGKIHIQYFKGDALKRSFEGEGNKSVPKITVNRTESLDATIDWLLDGKIKLPSLKAANGKSLENYNKFRDQLQMLIKEPVERANGKLEYEYKHNVPNHFGMALNSMRIASELASYNVTTGINPIFFNL